MELMNRFREEKVPFSVAVIDMDWHLVDIDPKYGSGWTGYTWNRDFFPDPERFLSWLHERGMHVTLNVHPADGVQAHEEIYPKIAEVMGVDAEAEEPVRFDIGNPKFLEAYFTYLHHPHEKEGVDFWWIDWQQGTSSGVEAGSPLDAESLPFSGQRQGRQAAHDLFPVCRSRKPSLSGRFFWGYGCLLGFFAVPALFYS